MTQETYSSREPQILMPTKETKKSTKKLNSSLRVSGDCPEGYHWDDAAGRCVSDRSGEVDELASLITYTSVQATFGVQGKKAVQKGKKTDEEDNIDRVIRILKDALAQLRAPYR
jgi:hypothetical protein